MQQDGYASSISSIAVDN